jgi:hypothetical protein
MTKGTVVYLNGSSGTLPIIAKAQANAESTSTGTYGVVQNDISNNSNGYVVVIGNLAALDTSAYTAGAILWLSPTVAGGYTTTKPVAPNHAVYVGIVTRSHPNQGTIEVKIQNGYELEELHNVLITSAANNDGLFWESATSLWKNKSISTVLGYTPANASLVVPNTRTLTINGTAYDLSADRTWTIPTHDAVTIGTANGLSLSGQVLSLALASTSATGALSSTDWNTFNGKQATITLTTTGSSGSSTLVGATLNIPTYTLAGLGGQPALNGTGFVKISGTTISYDNSTYLTTSSAASTYVALAGTQTISGDKTFTNGITSFAMYTSDETKSVVPGGVSSLTTLYVSGDLIVDTNTLYVDSTNNRVGISTTSPLSPLQVVATGTIVRLGEQSGTTGKQFLIGIDATSGRTELQSVWQGTGFTSLALQPSGGNVLIGTTGDNGSRLQVGGSVLGHSLTIQNTNSGYYSTSDYLDNAGTEKLIVGYANSSAGALASKAIIYGTSGVGLNFYTNGSTTAKMVIDTSGNVGIGTSSPVNTLTIQNTGENSIEWHRSNAMQGMIGIPSASNQIITGSSLNDFCFRATSKILFATGGDTERMRITSGGNVSIGSTVDSGFRTYIKGTNGMLISAASSSSNNAFFVENEAGNTTFFRVRGDGLIGTGIASASPYNNTTGGSGNVLVDSGGNLYRATSSLKYKKNVQDYTKGLAEVLQLRAVTYEGKSEADKGKIFGGLIAEEVHELGLTEFVVYAEDGTPDALAYSNMVALAFKAIQELEARIKQLENK